MSSLTHKLEITVEYDKPLGFIALKATDVNGATASEYESDNDWYEILTAAVDKALRAAEAVATLEYRVWPYTNTSVEPTIRLETYKTMKAFFKSHCDTRINTATWDLTAPRSDEPSIWDSDYGTFGKFL